MSRQFTPQTFFRCVSTCALDDFFQHLNLPMDVRWGDVSANNIAPVVDAYSRLDASQQKKAEKEMRAIFTLATSQGSECLAEAARQLNSKRYREEIPVDATDYERAVWCWQHIRKLFNTALRIQSIDNLNWWRKRYDLPRQQPDLSPAALQRLKLGISDYLVSKQGRGQQCTVDKYERGDTVYLFADPDDYITKYESHDKRGRLRSRRIRPTFTVGFAFCQSEGTSGSLCERECSTQRAVRESIRT
ncbi:hypothetical protein [Rubinisphaera margarita]|uniref:hypothetical protein n=1 Tax=Rubinisphaera margarita TaxID=2909586 RepID=UPI001EE8CF06|nr:hypothetical protein [Rubinisphaera margarita]MCG6158327.1 hypothetical protein [Rubinisphaera margarita]